MDPDANLKEQREIVLRSRDLDGRWIASSDDWVRLVDLVEALDRWLVRGGALPKAWNVKR